jgi:hypothetical protein
MGTDHPSGNTPLVIYHARVVYVLQCLPYSLYESKKSPSLFIDEGIFFGSVDGKIILRLDGPIKVREMPSRRLLNVAAVPLFQLT